MSTYHRRPKAEAFNNAVDVVVRLHGPTDQAPKPRHLRVLAHVQLDDDPRTPIQQSVGEEFRQHDGVVTILMFYRRRASPKHRYNIIEEYGGRGHRTRLRKRSRGSTCVSRGAPLPPYIKEQGGRRPALGGARQGSRIPTPTRRRTPPPWRAPRAGRSPPLLLYIRG